MGKATILESLGKGYYKIKVEFDNATIEAKKSAIEAELVKSADRLVEINAKLVAALEVHTADKSALDVYVFNTPASEYFANSGPMNALIAKVYESKLLVDTHLLSQKREKLRQTTLKTEKDYLKKYCPKEIETHAWCVAYIENLIGTLKSIEVDYAFERDLLTNQIRNDTGFWLPERVETPDSILQHPLASSPHATWFNLCMVPAMQRWQGRYRIAIITALNKTTNKCDIEYIGIDHPDLNKVTLLDDEPVDPQLNDTNQNYYKNANVLYMSCNAEAFEIGDKVIVDLHEGVPTVIGFYDNPRQCWPQSLSLTGDFEYSDYVYAGYWDGFGGTPTIGGYKPGGAGNETDCGDPELYYFLKVFSETHLQIVRTSDVSNLPAGYTVESYPAALTEKISFPGDGDRRWLKISDVEINSYEVKDNAIINFTINYDLIVWHVSPLATIPCNGEPAFIGFSIPAEAPVTGPDTVMPPTTEYLVIKNTASGSLRNYRLDENPTDKVFNFVPV